MCMRASLEIFGIFIFLNCYFFQYFVGTSDTLSVQMTCLSAYMYRQISKMYRQISKCTDKTPKKHYWGAVASPPPPPPSGYANDVLCYYHRSQHSHVDNTTWQNAVHTKVLPRHLRWEETALPSGFSHWVQWV